MINLKYENNDLITALNNVIINWDKESAEIKMLKREYEQALRQAGFDPTKDIYETKRGEYKTRKPIQVCLKNRTKVLQRIYQYYYGDTENATVQFCFDQAMKQFEKQVALEQRSTTSARNYRSNWARFVANYPIAQMPISKVKKVTLHEHYEQIVFDHHLSRAGLNDAKILFNKAFEWAVNHDIIDINMAAAVATKDIICRRVDNADKVYTDEERDKLLALFEKDDHVASKALSLMFCLCVRSGEIRALKWTDVDLENRTIYIHSQISRSHNAAGKNIYIEKPYTKNKSASGDRIQPLSDRAYQILKEQHKNNPFGTYVFEYGGHLLNGNMLNKRLKKICEQANIPYLPSHSIRFWSVTRMDAADVPAAVMQYMAGHKDPQTTDHYKRVSRLKGISSDMANQLYG